MRRASAGFSLLEVLVAFAILALSLGVLMRVFSGSLRNIDGSAGYARAVAIAESQLAAQGIETPIDEAEVRGEDGQGYAWTVTAQRADTAPPPEGVAPSSTDLYRVDVVVRWGGSGGTPARSLQVTTLRAAARK